MYNELINFIKESEKEYSNKISEINKKINLFKPIYDKLCAKDNKLDTSYIYNLTLDKNFSSKFSELLNENSPFLLSIMLDNTEKYAKYVEQTNKDLKMFGLSKEIIYSNDFANMIKNSAKHDISKKIAYEKLLEMKENDEKLRTLFNEIMVYITDYVKDKYTNYLAQKNALKDKQKGLKYALSKINRHEKLNTYDILNLSDLINSSKEKEKLSSILDNYIKSLERQITPFVVKQVFVDKDINEEIDFDDDEEEIPDTLFNNYVNYLIQVDSYDIAKMFFDNMSYTYDIKLFLSKLDKVTNDEKIIGYINKYLSEISKDDFSSDIKDENIILYNGFLENKNVLKSDLKKHSIPLEYYLDVKKGIEMIIKDGAFGKRQNIKKVPKVFKLRVNDIRIAFKRLKNNVYIIMGIYCKKDDVGSLIIDSIKRRNDSLLSDEKSIIKGLDISYIEDEIIKVNKAFEEELKKVLSIKEKTKL